MKSKVKDLSFANGSLFWALGKFLGFDPRNNWIVTYYPDNETEENDHREYFECCADDLEHAEEQCSNAYPDCVIIEAEMSMPYHCLYESGDQNTNSLLREKEIGYIRCGDQLWFATNEYASLSLGAHPKIQIDESCGVFGSTWPEAGIKWYVAMRLAEQQDCAPSAELTIEIPEGL